MQKRNSKRKGDNAERKVCSILEEWTSEEFVRVPASGGLRYIDKTIQHLICGDVVCTNAEFREKFPFQIEVKHYKDLGLRRHYDEAEGKLTKILAQVQRFWEQSQRDAERASSVTKQVGLLWVRENRLGEAHLFIVFIPKMSIVDLKKFKNKYHIIYEDAEKVAIKSTDLTAKVYKSFYNLIKT